jgi:hypothetical protein
MALNEDEQREFDRLQRSLEQDTRYARIMPARSLLISVMSALAIAVTALADLTLIVLGVRLGLLACLVIGVTIGPLMPILVAAWLARRYRDCPEDHPRQTVPLSLVSQRCWRRRRPLR